MHYFNLAMGIYVQLNTRQSRIGQFSFPKAPTVSLNSRVGNWTSRSRSQMEQHNKHGHYNACQRFCNIYIFPP